MIIPIRPGSVAPEATVTDAGGSRWKNAQDCLRKYYNMYEARGGLGLTKSNIPHPKMLLGTAFHESMRWYYNMLNGLYPTEAEAAGLDTSRPIDVNGPDEVNTWLALSTKLGCEHITHSELEKEVKSDLTDKLIQTVDLYYQEYKHELLPDTDGLKLDTTEMFLETVIDGERHTVRLDGKGSYNGVPILLDHKTTSKPWMHYLMSLKRDLSLMGYVYTAREKFKHPYHMLVNGVVFKNTKTFQVGFQRDIIYFHDHDMEDFVKSLGKVHSDIMVCKENNEWPINGRSCVKDMIICEFYELCNHPSTEGMYDDKFPIIKP